MIKTNIAFSQVREDPEIDLFILNSIQKKEKKVLMIGSGGCSILTMLLSPDLNRIDVIDANINQIELIKLKIEALRQLSTMNYITFVESDREFKLGEYVDSVCKIELFNRLKESSKYDLSFWDTPEHQIQIKYGINQIGVFEQLFKSLRKELINNPMKKYNKEDWDLAFEKVFNRENLITAFGEEAVKYSMSKEFTEHFSEVMLNAINEYADLDNYFLDQVFKGSYDKDLPVYLNKDNKETILKNLNKINFIHAPFHQYVKETKEKYHFVHTSNITDWLPLNILSDLYSDVDSILEEEGVVVSRRLNGDHDLFKIINDKFKALRHFNDFKNTHVVRNNIDFSRTIKENDTSYFYSEVLIGEKIIEI